MANDRAPTHHLECSKLLTGIRIGQYRTKSEYQKPIPDINSVLRAPIDDDLKCACEPFVYYVDNLRQGSSRRKVTHWSSLPTRSRQVGR